MVIPTYKTRGSAGADLRAKLEEDGYIIIHQSQVYKIPTGVFFNDGLPEGIEGQVRMRSGLACKGLVLVNGVGTIDSDFTGEVHCIITNLSDTPLRINNGDRIAQLIFAEYKQLFFEVEDSERGDGGFGSTGVS